MFGMMDRKYMSTGGPLRKLVANDVKNHAMIVVALAISAEDK